MSQKVSNYKKNTWATTLNINENAFFDNVKNFLFQQEVLVNDKKYGFMKFLLRISEVILYSEELMRFIDILIKKNYIKGKEDTIEGINKMLIYAMNKMPQDEDF
ncbi:hypothetical protein LCGC14_1063340 [marine sediment metagenome]|uniref:Uncharacterized protein n=1 Tax=marine sediment metagenome TaxID=412755 RepID=A0A0F9Q3I3_9ZZZZ|nr:hypothetical protein [bacterium]